MKQFKYVGESMVREDSLKRATGETKYICDLERNGMLYAKLVLSKQPHADVTIHYEEAAQMPGISAIYTYDDIPKIAYNSNQWFVGIPTCEDEVLLTNSPLHVGDRIALVVGENLKTIENAIEKLQISYKPKKAIVGLEEARANKDIIKSDSNLAFDIKFNTGNADESFKSADLIVEDSGTTPKIHHSALEPHACMCEIDENDNLVVYTPRQHVFQCQYHVAKVLNIPNAKVRVIKSHMGGSFGGKCQTILEPICAFACFSLRRPIKLVMNRKESIIASRMRNSAEVSVKTAVSKNGKLLARRIVSNIDGGAYYTNSNIIAIAMGQVAFRLYNIPHQTYHGSTYYTNTTSGGACRGYGSPQLHAITEINMDNIANKLAIDPVDFRLMNLIESGEKDPLIGVAIGNAQIKKCVIQGAKAFDWKKRRNDIKKKNTNRYFYGVGMACATHRNGVKGGSPDFCNVDISILSDGYVYLKVCVHEQGCGTIHTMKQIAAEALDIPLSRIILAEADTFITPYDSAGSHASRVTYVCGGAVKKAATVLKQRLIDFFCDINNDTAEQVETSNGFIGIKGGKEKLSYGNVAILMEQMTSQSMSEFVRYESPENPSSFSACFTEVKVDTYTGHVKIEDMLVVHDIGKAINPALVEGQILGGAQMSIGMALREEIIIDEEGGIKNDSFSKYHLINASEMPDIEVLLVEEIEPSGPYGAKSVGELAAVVPAPAILNAINFALNTNITKYPATPEVILKHFVTLNG